MKKLTLLFIVLFAMIYTNAQNVAINNDGTSAATSAMLDVKSTTKGFMMPRVTSAQRIAIASPAMGLLVFDTDTKTIWAYNGSSWTNLSTAGGGGFTLPYENTVAVAGPAFKITNTGAAIQGVSSNVSTSAISGTNNAVGGIGVIGSTSAATGSGVVGQSNVGTGVFGNSLDGVGVKASSTNGLALQVNGNLKISGGNTNPGNGAVLTSDASGNAVWKANRIAFRGFDINSNYLTVPHASTQRVHFPTENYDLGSGFTPFALNTSAPANASTFAIPIDGIYHFDVSLTLFLEDDFDPYTIVSLILDRGGNISTLVSSYGIESKHSIPIYSSKLYDLKISGDFLLFPGDKVYVEVFQYNDSGETATHVGGIQSCFSGHLVVAY